MFNQLDFGNIFNFTKEEEDEIDRVVTIVNLTIFIVMQ